MLYSSRQIPPSNCFLFILNTFAAENVWALSSLGVCFLTLVDIISYIEAALTFQHTRWHKMCGLERLFFKSFIQVILGPIQLAQSTVRKVDCV